MRHCQVNGLSGKIGRLSGTLRSFEGHILPQSGTLEPQNLMKYQPSGGYFLLGS